MGYTISTTMPITANKGNTLSLRIAFTLLTKFITKTHLILLLFMYLFVSKQENSWKDIRKQLITCSKLPIF